MTIEGQKNRNLEGIYAKNELFFSPNLTLPTSVPVWAHPRCTQRRRVPTQYLPAITLALLSFSCFFPFATPSPSALHRSAASLEQFLTFPIWPSPGLPSPSTSLDPPHPSLPALMDDEREACPRPPARGRQFAR
jgi:hypothetical protein